ncbi:MAG: extracellular solute-binding protein [Lachnospiraceae bacterium]|nr:extracellular solute-binding protein [Lachnospiraceae bacterium]MEE3461434.1 extracellular solute-binding protein [Lachnospiraceae bacterium]
MRKFTLAGSFLALCLFAFTFSGCTGAAGADDFRSGNRETTVTSGSTHKDDSFNKAETTPFGRYPETVTYTLGKMSEAQNSHMPEGDTYEDNAYTRYLKEQINVQNKDLYERPGDDEYESKLSIDIAQNKLPDVMVVNNWSMLQDMVDKGLIEDLTGVYKSCTSKRIKKIYESYSGILDRVTFDGKMMALPETNIDNGPSLFWVRRDWLDKCGLSAPETVDDVENVLKTFVEKDAGGTGHTVGLVSRPELTGDCGYAQEYQTDIIFASCGAYPQQWIRDKDQNIVYGSVQPEAKDALRLLRKMYSEKAIDQDFLVRNSNNIIDLILNGECGAFFGPWWAPNNPLMESVAKDPEADWIPCLISTDKDGTTHFASQNPTGNYVVVRKGYEHPEVVMKIISILFDKMSYGNKKTKALEDYYKDNVDPTARPLSINVDYKNALSICYRDLNSVLEDGGDTSQLDLLEGSYYSACKDFLASKGANPKPEDWAAYTSRITACKEIGADSVVEVPCFFFSETETMKKKWWKLKELESEAYLSIVTGDRPLSYFDEFVEKWEKEGGRAITQEVAAIVSSKQ